MRNLPTILAAAVLILIVTFYMCTFQVRFTEVAIKKTFGEPSERILDQPGLYFKWPWPIQSVDMFDTRIRILADRTEETMTADSKNIIITTTTLWTVADPYKFHRRFRSEEDGEKILRNTIRSQKKAVVGQYNFANFVSTLPQERKLREIETKIMEPVRQVALADFGIDLKAFGITRLTLPETVTNAIFDSMKQSVAKKAQTYQAEGSAQAQQIMASAEAARERIMAVAIRKVDEIRNEGNRRVSEIYSKFEEHPELRIFLDKLRTFELIFKGDTTFVMTPDDTPVDLFNLKPSSSSRDSKRDAVLGSAGGSD
jgi:membrane protease subunit HflC